jgi:hypothetical protein
MQEHFLQAFFGWQMLWYLNSYLISGAAPSSHSIQAAPPPTHHSSFFQHTVHLLFINLHHVRNKHFIYCIKKWMKKTRVLNYIILYCIVSQRLNFFLQKAKYPCVCVLFVLPTYGNAVMLCNNEQIHSVLCNLYCKISIFGATYRAHLPPPPSPLPPLPRGREREEEDCT